MQNVSNIFEQRYPRQQIDAFSAFPVAKRHFNDLQQVEGVALTCATSKYITFASSNSRFEALKL